MLVAASSTPLSSTTTIGSTTRMQDGRADPDAGHRGLRSATIAALRPMSGSAPRIDVELGVDRRDGGLERAQVLGLDALERAGQRREPAGDLHQPAADLDQRERQHGHDDGRRG